MLRHSLCFMILVFGSCSHDVADRYYGPGHPASSPDAVEVFYVRPARPYDVIADFQARGVSVDWMREKAAKVGADAIIVAKVGGAYRRSDTRPDVDSARDTASAVGHVVATAIKFKRTTPR